jgi:integrase/recombinase XerD
MNTQEFNSYLRKRYKKETIRSYEWSAYAFIEHIGVENLSAARYPDVMNYISLLRGKSQRPNHIAAQLAGVKALFNFLVSQGERIDNPAETIVLKDSYAKPLQPQNVFTAEELRSLMYRKERYGELRFRNQCLLSLLIYQGLNSRELVALLVADILLESNEVFVAAKTNTLSRILKLEPAPMLCFENYIRYERPELAKKGAPTDILLLSKVGTPIGKECIHYLLASMNHLFPGRPLNCVTVRQSVIVNKFKEGLGLREVQLFAGIKYASTVERYKPVDMAGLRETLPRFHPMG